MTKKDNIFAASVFVLALVAFSFYKDLQDEKKRSAVIEEKLEKTSAILDRQKSTSLFARWKDSNGKDAAALSELRQMLKPNDIEILIDQINISYPDQYPKLIEILKSLATESNKELIIRKFDQNIGMIFIINQFHWEKDVKDILIKHIDGKTTYVPSECLQALAGLKDPSVYPALKSYFVNGWNRHVTYGIIQALPGIDLSKEVPQAWEKALSSGNIYEAAYLAPAALDLGYLPAMDYTMNQLFSGSSSSKVPITIFDPEVMSARYLDFLGGKEQRLVWWKENQLKLHFDSKIKKWKM